MYKLVKIDGTELGYTESVNYIKINPNSGCYIPATREKAIGVAYNSTPYNLIGHNEIEGADTIIVVSVDVGFLVKKAQQNTANIDYISMMTGVEILPEEEVLKDE